MTKGSDNEFPSVLLDEQASAPTTPATGFWRVYAKSDGLYIVDDAGTETGPFGTGGGSSVVPWSIAPDGGAINLTNRSFGASNRAYYIPCTIPADCTITGARFVVGTQSGNISVGLYAADGTTRVATSGAVACPATGSQSVAFSGTYAATAGRFYIGFSVDNNTATFGWNQQVSSGISGPVGSKFQETAHPLPATATMSAGAGTPAIILTVSGGYP